MLQQPARFLNAEGYRLEGRLLAPERPAGGVVLCHPHPLHGGSMSSALIPALQRGLAAAGWAALRFNYRGVGRSEGAFDRGIGETKDVVAAIEHLRDTTGDVPVAVVGWSFGAMTGLRAAAGDPRVVVYAGIAPPLSVGATSTSPVPPAPERIEGWPARVLLVCGTEDPICTPDDLRAWAASTAPDARVEVLDGEDHMFSSDRDRLVRLVVEHVTA